LGDTSYLNSVLQLIGNIRNIASFFLNPKNQPNIYGNIKKKPLSFVICRLFQHFYPYPEKNEIEKYEPNSLLNVLGILNVIYKSKKTRNPNDLIIFILNTLHNELNELKDNNMNHLYPDKYNRNNVVECEISNFRNFNNSIISNNFNWFEIKETKCNVCGQGIYNFHNFNTFELDFLGTYNCMNKDSGITFTECLNYHEKFPKTQNLFCKRCGKYNQMSSYSKIFVTSHMLIFSLNRGDFEKDNLINIPFIIEEKLNLIFFLEKKEFPNLYELWGIVSITKDNNKFKYVSFCKSPIDFNWYLYDDDKNAQKIDLIDIIELHNNKRKFIPCLLSYKILSGK
jgi:ubiquitin C-terminal hydrolase